VFGQHRSVVDVLDLTNVITYGMPITVCHLANCDSDGDLLVSIKDIVKVRRVLGWDSARQAGHVLEQNTHDRSPRWQVVQQIHSTYGR